MFNPLWGWERGSKLIQFHTGMSLPNSYIRLSCLYSLWIFYIPLFVSLSPPILICLSVHLSFYRYVCLSVRLSVSLFAYLFVLLLLVFSWQVFRSWVFVLLNYCTIFMFLFLSSLFIFSLLLFYHFKFVCFQYLRFIDKVKNEN